MQVWTVWVHLHADFFLINIQSALHTSRFLIFGFNQSQVYNSTLGLHGCRGLNTLFYTILYKRFKHPKFWYLQGLLEPIPHRNWRTTVVKFWGSQVILRFPTVWGVSSSNPWVVQGSTVVYWKLIVHTEKLLAATYYWVVLNVLFLHMGKNALVVSYELWS